MPPKKRGRPARKAQTKKAKQVSSDEEEVYEQPSESSAESADEVSDDRDSDPDGSITQRGHRYRFQDVSSMNMKLNKVSIRRYIQSCHAGFVQFMRKYRPSPEVIDMVTQSTSEYRIVQEPHTSFSSWFNVDSIPMYNAPVTDKDLTNLFVVRDQTVADVQPQVQEMPPPAWPAIQLPFLRSAGLAYDLHRKKPEFYSGAGVHSLCTHLWSGAKKPPLLEKSGNDAPQSAAVFSCGGPVAALAISPRADPNGHEVLAVATFPNEELLMPTNPDEPGHVQVWTYDPNDLSVSKCQFVLEIPASTVLSLCWFNGLSDCPDLTPVDLKDALGLLAVATSKGTVLVYRLPTHPPKATSTPPVIRLKPLRTLVHPKVQVPKAQFAADESQDTTATDEKMDVDEENGRTASTVAYNNIPLYSLCWPEFHGGKLIAAISDARRIVVWDVTAKPEKITEEEMQPHLEDSDHLLQPQTTIVEKDMDAPLNSMTWHKENEIAVAFRNRTILVYHFPDGEVVYKESKPRTAGDVLASAPANFEGVMSVNTGACNVDGVLYSGSCYLRPDAADLSASVMPLLNYHQVQAFGAQVCARAGLFGTCGADGRLQQCMVGRIRPLGGSGGAADDAEKTPHFFCGRTALHLVRHRRVRGVNDCFPEVAKPPAKRPAKPRNGQRNAAEGRDPPAHPAPPDLLVKREQCAAHNWLELRLGDAALIHTVGVKKHSVSLPLALMDRRIEALTCVAQSPRTAGLCATGGEAGLVFVLPTVL